MTKEMMEMMGFLVAGDFYKWESSHSPFYLSALKSRDFPANHFGRPGVENHKGRGYVRGFGKLWL